MRHSRWLSNAQARQTHQREHQRRKADGCSRNTHSRLEKAATTSRAEAYCPLELAAAPLGWPSPGEPSPSAPCSPSSSSSWRLGRPPPSLELAEAIQFGCVWLEGMQVAVLALPSRHIAPCAVLQPSCQPIRWLSPMVASQPFTWPT